MRLICCFLFLFSTLFGSAQKYSRLANINDISLGDRHYISYPLTNFEGSFYYIQNIGGKKNLMKTDGSLSGTEFVSDLTELFAGNSVTGLLPIVFKGKLYFRIASYLYRFDKSGVVEQVRNQYGEGIKAIGLNRYKEDLIYVDLRRILAFDGDEERVLLDSRPMDPNRNYPVGIEIGNGRIPVAGNYFYFDYEVKMYRSDGTEVGTEYQFTGAGSIVNHEASALNHVICDEGIMASAYGYSNWVFSPGRSFEIYHHCSQGNPNCHRTPSLKAILDSSIFAIYEGALYQSVENLNQVVPSYGGGSLIKFGNRVFYAGKSDLWYSSGELNSAQMFLKTNSNGSSNPVVYVANDELLYFSSNTDEGRKMFVVEKNQDEYNTRSLFKFSDYGLASINEVRILDNRLICNAQLVPASGKSVLASIDPIDATLELLHPDDIEEESSFPSNFTEMGEEVWFQATNAYGESGIYKVPKISMAVKPLQYNGEALVLDNLQFIPAKIDNRWYFLAKTANASTQVWEWDGEQVKALNVQGDWLERPVGLFAADGLLYVFGEKLVKIDTNQVSVVSEYGKSDAARYESPVAFFGAYYFFAENQNGDKELCVFTPGEGVRQIKDINPGELGSEPVLSKPLFTPFNYELFFVAKTAAHGEELWKTDGTEAGTVRISDVNPGPEDGNIKEIAQGAGHQLFFVGNKNGSDHMYYTNGSAETTYSIDLGSSSEMLQLNNLVGFKDRVYFSRTINGVGNFWYTNGIPNGTEKMLFFSSSTKHDAVLRVRNDKLWLIDAGGDVETSEAVYFGSRGDWIGRINEYISGSRNHLITDERIYYAGHDGFGWEPHATMFCLDDENVALNKTEEYLQAHYGLGFYQWYNCDSGELIPGANGYRYTPKESGNYQCHLKISGCEVYTECTYFEVEPTTGIAEQRSVDIRISPNPSSGIFKIQAEHIEPWVLYNAQGSAIKSGQGAIVDISKQKTGLYFIRFEGKSRVYKLLKN